MYLLSHRRIFICSESDLYLIIVKTQKSCNSYCNKGIAYAVYTERRDNEPSFPVPAYTGKLSAETFCINILCIIIVVVFYAEADCSEGLSAVKLPEKLIISVKE